MTCHFIPERDKDKFKEFGARRSVQEVLSPSPQHSFLSKDGGNVLSLSRLIGKKATDMRRGQSMRLWQEALVITVTQDDGLTWTCEEIAQYVEGLDAQWYLSCFKGTDPASDTPEIAQKTNLKVFRKDARRVGLLSGSTWSSPLRVGFTLVLAIGLTMLTNWLLLEFNAAQANEFPPQRLFMLLAAVAVALVASTYFVNHLQEIFRERRPPDNLLTILHAKRGSPAYKKLVTLSTRRFIEKKRPRCIIVDDYDKLDFFTREVLLEAAEQNAGIGIILWVILESAVTATLRKHLVIPAISRSFCSGHHTTYQLLPLTLQERQNLLEKMGVPSELASEYRLVKNLTHGTSDDHLPEMHQLWDNFQEKSTQLDLGKHVFELGWILALNAYNTPTLEVGEVVWVSPDLVESKLSGNG